ncbi:MAG: PorV/PorQ family protein [Candidatus Delongbacteria bacterium]|nr:PorV/PorQ family protein [Candidatus Delongbacteria bacterium]
MGCIKVNISTQMKKIFIVLLISINMIFAEVFLISEANIDARSSALSSSDIAMNKNSFSVYSNPAGLLYADNMLMYLSYSNLFADVSLTNASFIYPELYKSVPVAFSIAYLNNGTFTRADNTTYHSFDLMMTASAAKIIEGIATGLNVKYFYSSIENYSSSGMAIDLSVLYEFLDGKINVGAGIYNLGFQFDAYNETTEDLPTSVKFGIANKLSKLPLEVGLEIDYYFADYYNYGIGLEFQPKEHLLIRAGYDFSFADKEIGTNEKIEKFAGTSLGISIPFSAYHFDFTYLINGELDAEFNLAAGIDLNKILNKK